MTYGGKRVDIDIKEFLKNTPAFGRLDEAHLDRMVRVAKIRKVKAGEMTDVQGEPADKFYMLISGRVVVVLGLDFGVSRNSYIVTTIGQGQMFAWSGMVGNAQYTAGGEARTDSVLLEFKVADLDQEFAADPELGLCVMRAVARTIASRLRKMQLQLVKQYAIRESTE
jgi:CRP-like cAMP-binding protein